MQIIKHIVIPGGPLFGFSYYGALEYLGQQNILKIEDITTIHATSVGTIVGTLLCLKYNWIELDNYIINRPWQNVFKFTLYSIISSFKNNGIFGIDIIQEIFLPLFNAKEIPIDITMKDFYDICNIELHFFTLDVNNFTLIDLSYKTHPDWTLIESIYCSCCLPILFKPFCKDNIFYTDGGILANCPIKQLFENQVISPKSDEVLRINIDSIELSDDKSITLIQYIIIIISKIFNFIQNLNIGTTYKVHDVFIKHKFIPINDIHSIINKPDTRESLINYGKECSKEYIAMTNNNFSDI